MGSLRNPVGPLPSSIYWRRRAVALSVLALLALLAVWAVTFGGPGGEDDRGGGPGGKQPPTTITPGPSSSGPAVTDRPGGRDEDEGGGTEGSSGGDGSGGDGGKGGAPGGGPGGEDGSGGPGGGGSAGAGGGSAGGGVPVGSSLPDCTGGVKLTLSSEKKSYAPGEEPTFTVVAENSSDKSCKVDFGGGAAKLTITATDGEDDEVWSSNDCPRDDGRVLMQVPAGGRASETVEWDRRASAPRCATPKTASAKAGAYRAEAEADGLKAARVSFSLAED